MNFKKITLTVSILLISILSLKTTRAQVGVGTTAPQSQLHVDVTGSLSDGITIENTGFSSEWFSEISGLNFNSVFNNSEANGNYIFKFDGTPRYMINRDGIFPLMNATDNTVTGAIDIGRFDWHFRRIYSRAIHTNDNTVNGGLRINIGSTGGVTADYNFSDFAFYPVTSQTKDLGRNGNFWRNFFFVSAFTPSDRRLKSNIAPLKYNLKTLLQLETFEYTYNFDQSNKKHFGFMAQQLKELIPEVVAVGEDKNKSLSVNYLEMTPILVKALQEQQALIQQQNLKIEQMESKILQIEKHLNMNAR